MHRLAALWSLVGLFVIFFLFSATGEPFRGNALSLGKAQVSVRQLASFEVNQTLLDNLDTVQVSFNYSMPLPASFYRDHIATYCVSSEEERLGQMPSVENSMSEIPTNQQSSGIVEIGPLVNMRCSWLLRFVTDGQVLGESRLLKFKHGSTQPLQIHLALTEKPDEMRVKWVSENVSNPVVLFGEERHKLTRMEKATQSSYNADDLCSESATKVSPSNFRPPGHFFDAIMTKLEAGKRYFYQVGDQKGELSDVRDFRMPPPAGNNSIGTDLSGSSMSFFIYGDMNSPVHATGNFFEDNGKCGTTMALIQKDMEQAAADPSKHRYVAVMHVGDLSYALGSTNVWDQFGHLIDYAASRLPYMISIGNHDYGYMERKTSKLLSTWSPHPVFEQEGVGGHDSAGECGVPAENRFHMPNNGNGVFWYSFDTGLVHHVVLSSEHDFMRGSRLHDWLVNDLKGVDRVKTPWLFLYIHRPMYCSVAYLSDYYLSLIIREELEPVLAKYHVDIVFSGHYHSYERTCAVFNERCFESPSGKALAPVHLMVGSGGYQLDDAGFYRAHWRKQGFLEHGYGRVHIYNATHLQFEFVSNFARKVKDKAWIVSTHDWPSKRERYIIGHFLPQDVAGVGATMTLAVFALLAVFLPVARIRQQQRRRHKRHEKDDDDEEDEEEETLLNGR